MIKVNGTMVRMNQVLLAEGRRMVKGLENVERRMIVSDGG